MSKRMLDTPSAPDALGPYSVAVEAGGLVFISGQVAIDPTTGAPVAGDVAAQTGQIMSNIGSILEDVGLGFDDVVKTTIFLTSMGDFPIVNEVYGKRFSSDPPARATVEVAALPGGFLVEIEAVASRG